MAISVVRMSKKEVSFDLYLKEVALAGGWPDRSCLVEALLGQYLKCLASISGAWLKMPRSWQQDMGPG